MAIIRISRAMAVKAIEALDDAADEDGYVSGSDADAICAKSPRKVAQIIACGHAGETSPMETWDAPVHVRHLENALWDAANQGFQLPEPIE